MSRSHFKLVGPAGRRGVLAAVLGNRDIIIETRDGRRARLATDRTAPFACLDVDVEGQQQLTFTRYRPTTSYVEIERPRLRALLRRGPVLRLIVHVREGMDILAGSVTAWVNGDGSIVSLHLNEHR